MTASARADPTAPPGAGTAGSRRPPATTRGRAVGGAFASSAAAKVFSVGCTLAQVPLVLHALQVEGYGLWVTVIGLTVLLNALDFGLGLGLQQRLAEAFAEGDLRLVRRTFRSGAAALAGLGLGLLAVGLPLASALDWSRVLNLADPGLRPAVRPALQITLVACALGLPLNALPRLAVAVQRGWIQGLWVALGSGATLGSVFLAARGQAGLATFVALATGLPLLQGLGLALHLRHALGWRGRGAGGLDRAGRAALYRASLHYVPTQGLLALLPALPPLALGWTSGVVLVAQYNLLQRLYSPLLQGQMLLLTPLLPVAIEAYRRGDAAWTRRAFFRVLGFTGALLGGVALVTALAPFLISHWTARAPAVPSAGFAWLAALWTGVQLVVLVPLYFLFGMGQLARAGRASLLALAGALLGWFGIGAGWGAEAALAAASAGLVAGAAPDLWAGLRAVRHPERPASA